MAESNRRDKAVFHCFAPHIVEQRVGHVELANLDSAHGYDAHENEGLHLGLEFRELGKKADGKKGNERPRGFQKW